MDCAFATVRDGQVALDAPVEWPDGTRLELRPLGTLSNGDSAAGGNGRQIRPEFVHALSAPDAAGLDESLWPLSPDEARLLLNHMDAAEPLDLTPGQQQEWDAERAATRQEQRELTRRAWDEPGELFP